jgi:hypothetical protein
MNQPAPTFAFGLEDKVYHRDAAASTFIVTRGWPDIDASNEQGRYYELRDERPIFSKGKWGRCWRASCGWQTKLTLCGQRHCLFLFAIKKPAFFQSGKARANRITAISDSRRCAVISCGAVY